MQLGQKIPIVGSLSDLEHRLGRSRQELACLLECRTDLYRDLKIPKKQHPYPGKLRSLKSAQPAKYRQIDDPIKQLKSLQRRLLSNVLSRAALPGYMFGAVSGRTLMEHAEQHVKNQSSTVVRMDISSYYPNITYVHVYYVWNVVLGCPPRIARLLTELTTFNWHLPQGAPTSPAIANIFLASIYAPICLASEREGLTITTWVDDLIFSGPAARTIMETVRATLAAHGFKMASEKREIFGPRNQKNITGTRLGRNGVRVTHKSMSELRAAIFRLAIGSVKSDELENYRRNLSARIAHIATIHSGDAEKIRVHAQRSSVPLRLRRQTREIVLGREARRLSN